MAVFIPAQAQIQKKDFESTKPEMAVGTQDRTSRQNCFIQKNLRIKVVRSKEKRK